MHVLLSFQKCTGISIKNIGIVHNREYEGGVLRIEFYQEEAIERSTKILCEKGYSLHNRK